MMLKVFWRMTKAVSIIYFRVDHPTSSGFLFDLSTTKYILDINLPASSR